MGERNHPPNGSGNLNELLMERERRISHGWIENHIAETLKNKDETEITRELLDETEELLGFGSWTWDIPANTVAGSHGLYALLEMDPPKEQVHVGLDFFLDHLRHESRTSLERILSDAVKNKTDFSCEFIIRTGTGRFREISAKGKPVTDPDGNLIRIVCINRDITTMRNLEKEQERSMRERDRSNKDLEEFAYIASHDLQEPLRKVSMFTERLRAKYQPALDREGELFIERILASAANMKALIESLLDFSRLNRRSHSFDSVDLRSLFDGLLSELQTSGDEPEPSVRFSGTLPVIEGVTSEMRQLFGNILSNAAKFRRSGIPVQIAISADEVTEAERQALGLDAHRPYCRIAIKDNGIGFDAEYSERIFQIFQRLNGKSEYPGAGIGLAICKKIAEKHNGLIFAESKPDSGAVFTVILPEKQM